MEKLTAMIGENPGVIGLFIAAIGAMILIGAILKWRWIVGEDNARVKAGLLGYFIYKLFGRRVFFAFTGACICLAGIAWFIVMGMM